MKRATFLVIALFLVACKAGDISGNIIDKPINFNDKRMQLSLEYMKERYGIEKKVPSIDPRMIVLHWTHIPTFEESFEAFDAITLPGARSDIQNAGALNVSAHFLVDRDGKIYQLMPETLMARHVIGLNHTAIGVENVGGTKETPLTEAQINANIWLVDYLASKYPIDYLIGHYEYTVFEDHPLWLEKDETYRTEKTDPGEDFMNAVRNATKNLNFKSVPGVN